MDKKPQIFTDLLLKRNKLLKALILIQNSYVFVVTIIEPKLILKNHNTSHSPTHILESYIQFMDKIKQWYLVIDILAVKMTRTQAWEKHIQNIFKKSSWKLGLIWYPVWNMGGNKALDFCVEWKIVLLLKLINIV